MWVENKELCRAGGVPLKREGSPYLFYHHRRGQIRSLRSTRPFSTISIGGGYLFEGCFASCLNLPWN